MTKYQVQDIFSFNRLKTLNTSYTDLPHTSLYVADPLRPKSTKPLFNYHIHQKTLLHNIGIITCLDYETLKYILDSIKMASRNSLALLLTGFEQHVDIICIALDIHHYIARSIRINMDWCRRMWSLSCREHMIAVTGVYYSVLGGAYCSLGKSNSKYAYKAGVLAIEQIKLAQRLKDPVLECKCWLYFAEDLIQLGRFNTAKKIISRQSKFVASIQEYTLVSMLEAVVGKLKIARINTKVFQQ